jgi:hypothetical protein
MNAKELLPGSRLIVRRRAYFHHGIYMGNGRMIHYAAGFLCTRGLVEETTLEQFTKGTPYKIGRAPLDRRAGEDIVRRARSRLGERRYHLLRNNCEHFCNWCQLGECRSEQVEALMKPALVLVGILQALPRKLLGSICRTRSAGLTRAGPLRCRPRSVQAVSPAASPSERERTPPRWPSPLTLLV